MPEDTVTTEEIQETMKTLGHSEFDIPGNANIEQHVEQSTEQEPEKVVEPDTSEETSEVQASAEETQEEEQERRTWQSEYDKLKNKQEEIVQQNQNLQAQNNYLMQMMSAPAQAKQPEKVEKEPELRDFIDMNIYNSMDATDPSTLSGQAYIKYTKAIALHNGRIAYQQESEKNQKQQYQNSILDVAEKIAEKRPEFKNPLTGKADLNKISAYMEKFNDPNNWLELFSQPQQAQTKQLSQVGLRSNKPSSVSKAATTSETENQEPEVVSSLKSMYGNNFQVPGNMA